MHLLFTPGDKVLLWHVVPGKMNLKVKGPYVFIHYRGNLQVTAHITSLDGAGETRIISAANLLPMCPKEPALLEAGESEEEDWANDITHISSGGNPSGAPGAGAAEALHGGWPLCKQ